MEKLKRSPFYFITNFIIRKYFLFVVVAVTFIVNGFFISTAFALSENVTQINFTSSTQSIDADTLSSVISIQTQNIDGALEKVSETTHLVLSSSSSTGKFYNANASACTTEIVSPFTLAMSSGTANKNFCYKDLTPGTHTLTISADGKTWINAVQDIIINSTIVTPPIDNFTEITSNINTDTILTKENNPYVIKSKISVTEGAILTIKEGVVIKFDNNGELVVDGKIEIQGLKDDPVYFTSFYDDSIMGDTDKDGGVNIPSSDNWQFDWQGITIQSKTFSSNLNNIIINYSYYGLIVKDTSISSDNLDVKDQLVFLHHSNSTFDTINTFGLNLDEGSSVLANNSIINSLGVSSVELYNGSSLYLKNSIVHGGWGEAIKIIGGSSLTLDNTSLNRINTQGDGINISGEGSILTMENSSKISDVFNGLIVGSKSTVNIDDSIFECTNNCISGSDANISITNSKVFGDSKIPEEGEEKYGISFYKNNNNGGGIYSSGDLGAPDNTANTSYLFEINNSEISGHTVGIYGAGGKIIGTKNSIHDNTKGAINIDSGGVVNLEKNYWGDKSGPKNILNNPNGLGNEIVGNVIFDPFLKYDPLKPHKDPVILIPGITGSYLVRDYGDKSEIWPDVTKMFLSPNDEYLNDLVLNYDGTENIEYPIVLGDIIRGISTVHVFDGLISELENNGGYIEGNDLFVFPYDWRKSTKENAILLKDKIDQIILNTGFDKVDIVAHSMGGLLAKKYIADNSESKIDQLIFLGTPQLGAPKAFKVLMYGDNMSYQLFYFLGLNQLRAKYISQNMPSVYELLPSLKYISLNNSYAINAINKDKPVNLDYIGTKDFLVNYGRNSKMFPFTEELHDSVDNLNLSSIKSYNFVGCGEPTIGKIKIKQEKSWIGKLFGNKEDYEIGFTDGDETVPLISSSQTIGSEIYYVKGVSHGLLPSASGVKENILAVLKNEGIFFGDVLRDDNSQCGIKGDVVSTHSPVELHIYDKEGNHTGPKENGDIEYSVPGVLYEEINDISYVFLPGENDYKVVTKATDIGGFNLKIEKQNKEEILDTYNWTLIPLKTIEAVGEIWIGSDYLTNDYKIKMDDNGDGIIDEEYPVSFDGTKLAEESSDSNKTESSINSSGSILSLKTNKIIENPLLTKTEKPITDNIYKFENINKKEIVVMDAKKDITKEEKLENSNLTASAIGTGINTKIIGSIIILIGVVLLIAKLLLKL